MGAPHSADTPITGNHNTFTAAIRVLGQKQFLYKEFPKGTFERSSVIEALKVLALKAADASNKSASEDVLTISSSLQNATKRARKTPPASMPTIAEEFGESHE